MAGLSEPEPKDEEVGEFGFLADHGRQRRTDSNGAAEVFPLSEDGVTGGVGLSAVGGGRDIESIAEVSREAVSFGRCSRTQGLACG